MYKCNQVRLQQTIDYFSRFGATENGGVTRLSLSEEDLAARQYFSECCEALGMEVKMDDMANMYAVLPGKHDLPPIVMGSHLDSVVRGGRFDGVLGILTALEAVRTIVDNDIELDAPLIIVNFTNEEGARFEPAMMSSGVITGKFDKETMMQATDREGVTFAEALSKSGYEGKVKNRLKEAYAYLELHIEQGPVLETEGIEIGVVEGVMGMVCYEIHITGESNHAGTTPMKIRKDPMLIAAKLISYLDKELGDVDETLVYTFGRMNAAPNIPTVIPNEVVFTIDSRHEEPKVMEQVERILLGLPEEDGGCTVQKTKLWGRDTVHFSPDICNEVEAACQRFGYSSRRIYSGAGHDAQFIASIVPSVMIFVPSAGGKSHCEEEETSYEECARGADVLLESLLTLQAKQSLHQPITIK
jgi:beta-ureidopropionase / N-carbamoyl-L-amino-acid hydrolase